MDPKGLRDLIKGTNTIFKARGQKIGQSKRGKSYYKICVFLNCCSKKFKKGKSLK